MPEFRASRCTRFRYRYSQCRRCADACPDEAIELTDSGAVLLQDRCVECALCVTACHTDAWLTARFQPFEILRQAIRRPSWSLTCEPSGERADATVPCLAAVDAVWLAYMAKRRIPVTLRGSAHCGQCRHGRVGAGMLQLHLDAVRALSLAESAVDAGGAGNAVGWAMPMLEDGGAKAGGRVRGSDADATSMQRQSLFRRIFRRPAQKLQLDEAAAAKTLPTPEKAIRAGPYALSDRRELLQIVCQQKDQQPCMTGWHEALPLMVLFVQPGCTLCEACFRVCPTGAIQIVENPGDWALTFQTDRCVGCEVCLEVCQPRVLDAQASFDARPEQAPVVLISRVKQRCSRCDRHFASAAPQATCPVCSDDEDAFDQIFG